MRRDQVEVWIKHTVEVSATNLFDAEREVITELMSGDVAVSDGEVVRVQVSG